MKLKKHLHKYVKKNLKRGYSISQIKKAIITAGYDSDYTDSLINSYKQKQQLTLTFVLLSILLISTGILIFQPNLKTGWSGLLGPIELQEMNYTDALDLAIDKNSNHTWLVKNPGEINSIKLSGTISSQGSARIYLLHETERYLIFDSKKLPRQDLIPITGAAVSDIINNTNQSAEINNTNQSINITQETSERTIKIDLAYKNNTEFDVDNDGTETIEGIVDLTVEGTTFDWGVNYSKVCTIWEVYNEYEEISTFTCYGAEKCCNYVDLVPAQENWNGTFNLNYGNYDSGLNNTVAAHVKYFDFSLEPENTYLYTYNSDLAHLKAIFEPQFFSFENICLETCTLPNLNYSHYTLLFEIDNATLNLDSIIYTVRKLVNITPTKNITKIINETTQTQKVVINQPVKWIKKIKLSAKASNVTIKIPKSSTNISVKKIDKNIKWNIEQVSIEVDNNIRDLELHNLITGSAVYEGENYTLIINEEVQEIEVEYYTKGPKSLEEKINKYKKKITISSDIHYENIQSYTYLETESPADSIHLYWLINNSKKEVDFDKYDTNDNNLIDYIEWIVPYLSNQTYELEIIIIDAGHLDKDRNFITNIYDEVNETDNITYTIPKKEFVRAYFKRNLTNENIIDIVVQNKKPATIEIYEKDSEIVVGKLENSTEGIYYISLNHTGTQSIFDMKSADGKVTYDYIHDAKPATLYSVSLTAPTTNQYINTIGSFTMECTVGIGSGGAITSTVYFRLDENNDGCDAVDSLIPETGTPGTMIYGDLTTQTTTRCSSCTPSVTTTIYGYESGGPYNLCCHANEKKTDVISSETITVEVVTADLISPNIEIRFPPNNTNISNNQININYTVSDLDSGIDSCWYSNDTYTINISLPSCENITTITWSEGQHNVTIWVNDSAANQNSSSVTFFVDSLPPYFTSIANILTYESDSIYYDIDALDDGLGVDCFTVNDTNFKIDCAGILENNTPLSIRTYWLNITVNDTLNNWNSIIIFVNITETPDLISPSVKLTSPNNFNNLSSDNISFNCSMKDSDTGLKNSTLYGNWSTGWHANETILITGSSNYTEFTKTITDGTYLWNCYVCDQSGNCRFNETNNTFTADTTNPIISLDAPLNNTWQQSSQVTFQYTPSDTNLKNCTLYGDFSGTWAPNQTNTSPTTDSQDSITLTLTNGTYLWNVLCYDYAGNSAFNSTNYTINIDSIKPTTNLDNPDSSFITSNPNINFEFTVTDNLDSSLLCNLTINSTINVSDIPAPNGSKVSQTVLGFQDGYYLWNVTCWDNASNVNTSLTRDFTVDSAVLTIVLNHPKNDSWQRSQEVTINYTVTGENIDACVLFGDFTGTWTENRTNSSPIDGSPIIVHLNLTNGTYTWNAKCNKTAGSTMWASKNYTFHIDSIKPTIDLNAPDQNYNTTSTSINFNWTTTDNLAPTLLCNLTINGIINVSNIPSANSSYTNKTVIEFIEGDYLWNVTCWDNASNTKTSQTRILTIDNTNPIISLNTPLNNTWQQSSQVIFQYTPTDTNLRNCTLYGDFTGTWTKNQTNTSPTSNSQDSITLTLTNKTYLWNVLCYDYFGNYAFNSTNYTVNIDSIKPNITLHNPIDNYNTTSKSINFNWTTTDNLDNSLLCNLTIDGMINISNIPSTNGTPTNQSVSTINDGIHNWNIACWDGAYNFNTSISKTFTIDTLPPYFTVIENISVYDDETLVYDIDASDDGGGVDCFTVNDTNFKIDCTGLLQNTTALSVRTYWLNITVNDTLNNLNYIIIYVDVITNQPPSTPTNIKCNSTNDCDIMIYDSVFLNASGSIDIDNDEITYFLEASLINITKTQDLETGTIQKNGFSTGLDTNKVNLMFEDFETTTWTIITNEDPSTGCTGGYGNFNNCQDNGDYEFAKSSGGTAVSGTYMWVADGWGTWISNAAIWYSFNPQTACNGNPCDDIMISGYGAASSLDDVNDFCVVWARNDSSVNYSDVWTCRNGEACEFSQGNSDMPTILGHWTYFETNFTAINLNLDSSTYSAVHIGGQGSSPHDQCYYDDINITGVYYTIASSLETNTSETIYRNADGNYSMINNITIRIGVDSYNPEASVQLTTNDPDLYLEIYNGSEWIGIGEFNLDITYTLSSLDTTNHNFTLTTTYPSILSAWQNAANQDVRIKGIYMDYYDQSTIDEINYTNIWIIIDGIQWIEIGNHSQYTTLIWNTTELQNQTCVDLRARAIDLFGNNTFSDYFTKNSCLNINHTPPDRTPPKIRNATINNASAVPLNTLVKVNASIIDNEYGIDTVILEIIPPISASYNISPLRAGDQFYDYIVLDETGQWQFRFYANDSAGNNAIPQLAQDILYNYYIECDGNPPSITNEIKYPEPSYNDDDVNLDATITDLEENNDSVWISGNWTGIWKNYTEGITNIGSLYSFNLKAANLSNQQVVGWRYYANDSVNNVKEGNLQQFTVQNRVPSNVTLIEPKNGTMTPDRTVFLNWSDAIDLDGDNITYILQIDDNSDFSSLELEKTGLNYSNYTLDYLESLANGIYYWRVYSNDSYSANVSLVWQFEVNPSMGISIGLSNNLSLGIFWDIDYLPVYNVSAINNNGTGITGYDVAISTIGLKVDVYIKADGDLMTPGGDLIPLGNETFSYNLTNSSVPSKTKYGLTTNFLDNKIGESLEDGSAIYLKFFLNVGAGQAAGNYTNNVNITAVPEGYIP